MSSTTGLIEDKKHTVIALTKVNVTGQSKRLPLRSKVFISAKLRQKGERLSAGSLSTMVFFPSTILLI